MKPDHILFLVKDVVDLQNLVLVSCVESVVYVSLSADSFIFAVANLHLQLAKHPIEFKFFDSLFKGYDMPSEVGLSGVCEQCWPPPSPVPILLCFPEQLSHLPYRFWCWHN